MAARRKSLKLFGPPWALAISLALALLVGFLGAYWWVFDLASHFRVQYAYAGALLLGWFAMLRAWRGVAFVAVVLAVDLVGVFALASSHPVPPGAMERAPLRIVYANVYTQNERHDRLLELVREEKPDLVLLEELDDAWVRGLAPLEETHPHRFVEARPDNFGIGIYSKLPLAQPAIRYWGNTVPTIEARVVHAGRKITVLLTHPVPPRGRSQTEARNRQLRAVATEARGFGDATILIGDFNATPWSHIYHEALAQSGLQDSTQGYGPQPTWPARLPALCRIPIDHCWHSADLQVTDRRLGPKIGSDHLPLILELR